LIKPNNMAQIPRPVHSKLSWDVDRGNYLKGWQT